MCVEPSAVMAKGVHEQQFRGERVGGDIRVAKLGNASFERGANVDVLWVRDHRCTGHGDPKRNNAEGAETQSARRRKKGQNEKEFCIAEESANQCVLTRRLALVPGARLRSG
jgi:hypothetical protein